MIVSDLDIVLVFFFNDTATTEIYTLSLHDALPISCNGEARDEIREGNLRRQDGHHPGAAGRSEEHTSELQSRLHLVCRLLLEKKKTTSQNYPLPTPRGWWT